VFHVIDERAYVLVPVLHGQCAAAVHQAIHEISFVLRAVLELHGTFTVESVVLKRAIVSLFARGKVIDTIAIEHTILEFSFIVGAVGVLELATARALPLVVFALVLDGTVVPGLSTIAMLQILLPLAVARAPLLIHKNSVSVCHRILPEALVDVPVLANDSALPTEVIMFELADVDAPVL